ncbi:tail completion protein gp17 [Massilia antarctica]|uniref:tail completion protein gp17 n=1 Tax=Massilia antarctica TaxID=2765360 RepID=UPI0015E19B22|nr:DUF3168 domain-containing protein [Massilia sp. H27-R4]MCY0911125.1 DUF3168 domain-containing protein [Massilia sp. H27-R4]
MESMVTAALAALVGGRVYFDVPLAPLVRPLIVIRALGGTPITFLDGSAPAKEITRVEVAVWGSTRIEASNLGKQVEDTLRATTALQTTVFSGRSATVDSATDSRLTVQQFEFFV